MVRAVVFLGGIPGAGKTTLAQAVAVATGCIHWKASQLIREGRAIVEERPDVRDIADADLNQRALVMGFQSRSACEEQPILLDGHFIVPTRESLYPVPEWVFASLRLSGVAVLDVDATTCAGRLRSRDAVPAWWDGSTETLEAMQAQERAHCERIAAHLRVPRIVPTLDELAAALASR